MPRPVITDYRGALLSGYSAPEGATEQAMAVETILDSRRQLPNWVEVVDLTTIGADPRTVTDAVINRGYSCVAIPVLDEAQFDWAERLARRIKNADEGVRTLGVVLGTAQRVASVIQSVRSLDAAVRLDPILLSTTPRGQQAPDYPYWRLSAATFIDILMRVVAREALSDISGIVYRCDDGSLSQRPQYCPHLFGDQYYGEWHENTAVGIEDQEVASRRVASLVYGELTETAGRMLLSDDYCDASRARTLYDLGMGTGRLALQSFANCPSLRRVVGVELSSERYRLAADAARKYAQVHRLECTESSGRIRIYGRNDTTSRELEFICGDLFDVPREDLQRAEIVLIMTEIPQSEQLDALVNGLSADTRLASNLDLSKRVGVKVEAIPKGRRSTDGFATSFSPNYYYYVWRRIN